MDEVRAQAYLVEASNVRHEADYRVWQDVKLPDGKILIPGVVGHATSNLVESPEPVTDRLMRYARIVGRENVIAAVMADRPSLDDALDGYAEIGQPRWVAWRRKLQLTDSLPAKRRTRLAALR